jgi:hypothetical protein
MSAGPAGNHHDRRATMILDMMLINAFSPIGLIEMFEDIVAPNGAIAAVSSELAAAIAESIGSWAPASFRPAVSCGVK